MKLLIHPMISPDRSSRTRVSWRVALIAAALLSACAIVQPPTPDADGMAPEAARSLAWEPALDPGSAKGDAITAAKVWRHQPFPGKRANHFQLAQKDGRQAVLVQSRSSISVLRQDLRVEPADLGRLRFSWRVPMLIEAADLAERDASDSTVRVVLAFEGDRSKFSARDSMLSELAHALTGEPMPYATLMYVWCNTRAPGTVINSPGTSRIRKLVVQTGPDALNRWLDYERDVRADFEKAFGEPPGALLSIGIMTDSDNTRSQAQAWYGPIRHVKARP